MESLLGQQLCDRLFHARVAGKVPENLQQKAIVPLRVQRKKAVRIWV